MRCVEHLLSLAERVGDLEEENSELRSSRERLRLQNEALQRQVLQLKAERNRPVERLRGVIDGCVREREVRRLLEGRPELQASRPARGGSAHVPSLRKTGLAASTDALGWDLRRQASSEMEGRPRTPQEPRQ